MSIRICGLNFPVRFQSDSSSQLCIIRMSGCNYNTVIFQMKTRTKSTRENLTLDSKSRKISEETNKQKKNCKKDETETRKYLVKTLALLQQNYKIEKMDKKSNNSQLSASIYEIVKNNISTQLNSFSKSHLQDYSSSMQTYKENQPQAINKSAASLLNVSAIHAKRRSNSTLDQYFKEKFGSPAKDEQTIEKKLRVLKALKKSQQIVTKASGVASSNNPKEFRQTDSILGEMDRNVLIVQKLRSKKTK